MNTLGGANITYTVVAQATAETRFTPGMKFGSYRELRGIPVAGVDGSMPGTNPERAVLGIEDE